MSTTCTNARAHGGCSTCTANCCRHCAPRAGRGRTGTGRWARDGRARRAVPPRCGPISSSSARCPTRWTVSSALLPPPTCSCRSALTRSEEHTSELQSLMRISYAVFCLKKKTTKNHINQLQITLVHHDTIQHNNNHEIQYQLLM